MKEIVQCLYKANAQDLVYWAKTEQWTEVTCLNCHRTLDFLGWFCLAKAKRCPLQTLFLHNAPTHGFKQIHRCFQWDQDWSLMLSLATDHWTFMSSSGVRTSISKSSYSLIEVSLLCFSSFIIDNTFLSVSSDRMCQTCTRSPMSCSVHSSSVFSLLSEGWAVSRWLLMENCTFVEASQVALSGTTCQMWFGLLRWIGGQNGMGLRC